MSFFLCKLWPYLAGGLIGWLLAGWLARRFKNAEPPVERIVEKIVEVDNPKHLSLISKLEGENSQISGLMSKVSHFESRKPEVVEKIVEKRVEVDNPKHLALISQLEKENAEISGFRAKLSAYETQEATLRKLKEENAQISVLQYNIKNFETKAEKEGDEIADLHSKATRYRAQIEKLESDNKHFKDLQEKLNDLEDDEPKQLALISRLERENKELADLKVQQAKFEAQEDKILSLEADNAKASSLQNDLARFKSDNTQHLSLIAKLENENKELDTLRQKLSDFDAQQEKMARLEVENKKIANLQTNLNRFESDNTQHLSLIGKLEQEKTQIGNKITDLEGEVSTLKGVQKLDLAAAKSVGITLSKDGDFTAIEGIGPKISELIYADGIKTFKDLSEVDPARLQTILDKAGPQYKMANPGTWPDQAHLACNNRWPALKALQDILDGGVYPDGTKAAGSGSNDSAKVQKLEAELKTYREKEKAAANAGSVADIEKAKAAGFTMRRKGDQDDFTVIEGIGPKINELIHAKGIHTFSELADTKETLIQTILDNAGPSFTLADPETWSAQSDLAAKNEWEKLMKWQDELDGGKS
jgi:predicted flap endonuclease-1-like 5' DNA nuclease